MYKDAIFLVLILGSTIALALLLHARKPRHRVPPNSSHLLPMDLPFSTTTGYFEYQCKFGYTDLHADAVIAAIVLDARVEAGTSQAIKTRDDGNQIVMLRIAASDGGFTAFALNQNPGPKLEPGNLVLWRAGQKLAYDMEDDPRSAWVGLLIARIEPILAADGMHRIIADYRRLAN